jgi:diguanylate cyclase
MALEYSSQIGLEAIMPVLDEYVVWYGKLMKSYFAAEPFEGQAPEVFGEWVEKALKEKNIEKLTAERLRHIHKDMAEAANDFARKYTSREKPPLQEYDELNRHYEEFIQMMRRVELDHATENSGFDEKTGLRSVKLMRSDLAREMERRARRGNPFSVALVKINKFDNEWAKNEDAFRAMIRHVSDRMKDSLRSFDDAYYIGDEYFLLALKHADMLGSQAAISRLNRSITSAHITVPGDPLEEISVSTVVSEPIPGDDFDKMLDNMKNDLKNIDSKGTVVQYTELSPLQRYIHSIERKK